jgi:hypothetical protein
MHRFKFKVQSYVTTDGQSASSSWNKPPIWGLRPDFHYCQTIAGFLIRGALSDERTRFAFYNVQYTIYLHFTCYYLNVYTTYIRSSASVILGTSLYNRDTDHTENTVLLLRNLTTVHREPSSHSCWLNCLQNCFLAASCNIRSPMNSQLLSCNTTGRCLPSCSLAIRRSNPLQYVLFQL